LKADTQTVSDNTIDLPAGEAPKISRRVHAIDWTQASETLNEEGWVILPKLLTAKEASSIAGMYPDNARFRNRIVMAAHGFGRGEYKYFSYPLPPLIKALRSSLYPYLASIANGWLDRLGKTAEYPAAHADYLKNCSVSGQVNSTLTLLQYGPNDYNCLHQDIHGNHVFPLQVAILLDEPGKDFEGGQFLMSEQRPRMQTRGMVVEPFRKGDGVLFTAGNRPVRGIKGEYQVKMRHGVNRVTSGRRRTLGIIFHDAV